MFSLPQETFVVNCRKIVFSTGLYYNSNFGGYPYLQNVMVIQFVKLHFVIIHLDLIFYDLPTAKSGKSFWLIYFRNP